MIKYNSNNISDWDFGTSNIVKVYYGVTSGSRLPQGYTEVEYVENQNNAYINTLFKPNQDTRIIAEMQCVTSTNSVMHFGAGGWDRVDGMWLTYETGINGTLHVAWLGKTTWSIYGNGDYNKHTYDWNKNELYKDGTLVGSSTYGTYQCPNNLAIFANLQGDPEVVGGLYMKGKMYSFKIYDNGTLVRDLVPCINPNNVVGVYDIVNDVFYGSANSNPLVAGSAVSPSESGGRLVYQKITSGSTPPTPPTFGFVSYGSNGNVLASGNCDSLSSGVVSRSVITNNGDISINAIYAVEFGSCVTTIADYTFQSDGNVVVSSVTFDQHSQLTTIGNRAFKDAKKITSITLPNSLITLGDYAFSYTDNIVGTFTIPSGVTNIGTYCFEGLSKVTSFVIEATTPPTLGNTPFIGTSCPIYVPAESVETYKAASGWSTYASRLQAIQT